MQSSACGPSSTTGCKGDPYEQIRLARIAAQHRSLPSVRTWRYWSLGGALAACSIAALIIAIQPPARPFKAPLPLFVLATCMAYVNAFLLGAQSVNPDFKLKVVWVNTWFDAGKEADAATTG